MTAEWLVLYASLVVVAVSAYAGSYGLVSGRIALSDEVRARIPWQSTTLAGWVLLLAVALPVTVAIAMAWRGHRRTRQATLVAGAALVCWTLVQLSVVRELSLVPVAHLVAGVLVIALARALPSPTRVGP